MSDVPKRFDDWEKVNCNECEHYYDNSCDGVPKGTEKPCNSFLATRNVVIPEKVKALEKRVNTLLWCTILLDFALLLHIILSHILEVG